MAHMPVEVIDIGDIPAEVLTQGLTVANSLQNEFFFDRLPETDAAPLLSKTKQGCDLGC